MCFPQKSVFKDIYLKLVLIEIYIFKTAKIEIDWKKC